MRRRPSSFASFALGVAVAIAATSLVGQAASSDGDRQARAQRYEDLALFTSVLELVRNNYVDAVDEHELLMSAMRGILEGLDPHSAFMTPEAYEDMQVETKGEFQGLGIEISKEPGTFIEVVAPIDGTPAKRAGIRARDRITSICPTEPPEDWEEECRGTADMSLFDAVGLMRGRKGTTISIYVIREGMSEPQRYDIKRDTVKVASVRARMVEPGYGYVQITSFQERTGDDVRERLAELREESEEPLAGLVLDLRDNPGGLLNQAVEVADQWLREGLVVYTQGRDESERTEYRASDREIEVDYPMVVLVNEGSASASEIVAGALQDHHRAMVLGVSTFGKGSVQTVYPLEGGAGLRLTTALYYTPSGRSIQEVGISPDFVVRQNDAAIVGIPQRRRVRERDLQGHFTQEDATGLESGEAPDPGEAPSETDEEGAAPDDADRAATAGPDDERPDVQLTRAVELLKSWGYFEELRRQREEAGPNPQAVVAKSGVEGDD
ncbi:MAG: S41 family peptidase [Deltaproteobacteria bacterium]|jgi:carboxyl-terminal processing protease|nr:S41 family peptidase [Deltaproteobacteria bacterium]